MILIFQTNITVTKDADGTRGIFGVLTENGGLTMAKMPKYYKIHTDGCTVELEPIYEELVPVVHGRWDLYGTHYCCSSCLVALRDKVPYCPNCGAKMDVEWRGE